MTPMMLRLEGIDRFGNPYRVRYYADSVAEVVDVLNEHSPESNARIHTIMWPDFEETS